MADLDATIITAESPKTEAAGTWKGSFGFHPLGAWIVNTGETAVMTLREGNAGSNTAIDHTRCSTS